MLFWKTHRFTIVTTLIGIGVGLVLLYPVAIRLFLRSRQVEAKIALASLYQAEANFFGVFGAYGNNLAVMPVRNPYTLRRYLIGFPDPHCQSLDPMDRLKPRVDSTSGQRVEHVYPDYYVGMEVPPNTRIPGPESFGLRNCGIEGLRPERGEAAFDVDVKGPGTFLATAMGEVKEPGEDSPGSLDIWSIDEQRRLVHLLDGAR